MRKAFACCIVQDPWDGCAARVDEHKDALLAVAQHLQENEVIDGEEFVKVIGQFGIRKVAEKSDELSLTSQQRSTA